MTGRLTDSELENLRRKHKVPEEICEHESCEKCTIRRLLETIEILQVGYRTLREELRIARGRAHENPHP